MDTILAQLDKEVGICMYLLCRRPRLKYIEIIEQTRVECVECVQFSSGFFKFFFQDVSEVEPRYEHETHETDETCALSSSTKFTREAVEYAESLWRDQDKDDKISTLSVTH